MRTLIALIILISTIWLPSTTNAQNAIDLERRAACVKTDGSVVLSKDSFRRCLRDEVKASKYDEALEASRKATARANAEAGAKSEVANMLREERVKSDQKTRTIAVLELNLEEARDRPSFWTGLAWGAGVGVPVAAVLTFFVVRGLD